MKLNVLALLILIPTFAMADNTPTNQFYIGGHLGKTTFGDDGLYNSYSVDEHDDQWTILVGMPLSSSLDLEFHYADLGTYQHNDPNDYLFVERDEYRALAGLVRYTFNPDSDLNFYGKGGLSFISLRQVIRFGSGSSSKFDSIGMGFYLAGGARYRITDTIAVFGQLDTHFFWVEAENLFGSSDFYLQSIYSPSLGIEAHF